MRVLAVAVLLLLAAAPAASAAPTAIGTGGAAASVDPYATKAAIAVLRAGGNAIDAAVAAAGVLGVVEPYSSGVGGGGFMVIRTADGTIDTIDGREFAPKAFTPRSFLQEGKPMDFDTAVTSGLSVGVPGTPDTWRVALARYGTQPLRALMKPGIRLAAHGFVVDKTLHQQTVDNAARFRRFPATKKLYLPGGKPIKTGSTLRNPGLARTYRRIARLGTARGFYRGPIARALVATVRHPAAKVHRGAMTRGDLTAYRALRRAPVTTDYRGYTIAGMGPPSSGGTTVLEALNIMEAFGAPAASPVEELHRYIEASRYAFADRNEYVGDPAFVDNPLTCLLSQDFANARQALIGPRAPDKPVKAGDCPGGARASTSHEGPNTTHLTVADAAGNVVTYTFTIEQTGGSGMVVPGRGFLLNNELTDFNFEPGTANSPAARKRPRSSMSPTLVLKDGRLVLAVGSPGGSTIITTVLQILVDRFERGMTLPQAIADPRVSENNLDASAVEPAFRAGGYAGALRGLGHRFVPAPGGEIGAATGIEVLPDGRYEAAAEPVRRGGGSAMVVTPAGRRGG